MEAEVTEVMEFTIVLEDMVDFTVIAAAITDLHQDIEDILSE